ncbi:MAG TPA: excinuclease ABC subunit UvrC [Verrucomicrobiae bacterium]|nr:excinuclease ABC subunit UvrC [Verrucomicrobiae bacterium]
MPIRHRTYGMELVQLRCHTEAVPITDQIRNKLSQLPHKPGVYLMKDRFGTVIYVGKARDLRKRVSQYFHPSRRLGWDLKFNALVEAIHDFDVHAVRSEPESLLLEGKLIKEFQPRYNVSFRDDKRFLLLKVNLQDPIPRFTLTRLRTDDGARYFGPFPHSGALRNTLTLIRRQFNLRGCRPLTPTESDYRHCLYGNLKWCTAPCIGNVTRDQYLAQVQAACEFLDGQSHELEKQLETEMAKAAHAQDFEKAAQIRDMLFDLRKTAKKTEKFERIPYKLPISVMPERDNLELGALLKLARPPVRIEGFDISNISGTLKVASVVAFRHGRPDRANYRRMRIKSVDGQDDFACIAEAVRRRYSRLLREASGESPPREDGDQPIVDELRTLIERPFEAVRQALPRAQPADPASGLPANLPDLIVIDGGKGQLNAACEELARLGLSAIPIIGLAKEFEEIYRPGESEPIRLEHDNNALKLLQRIRDESHRVANSYNAQLRLKKISESVLDEFPGIGEARKAALLKKFGSVQRIRLATVEHIAEVPGFGGKAAGELKSFLDARGGAIAAPTPEEPAVGDSGPPPTV